MGVVMVLMVDCNSLFGHQIPSDERSVDVIEWDDKVFVRQ